MPPETPSYLAPVLEKFGSRGVAPQQGPGAPTDQPTWVVSRDALVDLCRELRDGRDTRFDLLLEIFGMEMPRLAKRAARESGIPLMVHIGDTTKRYDANVIRQLLPILEPGDIVTHLFTANPGGVLDGDGRLVPEAKELAGRGVWLDTAHGRMNFGFNVGRKVLDQGLIPPIWFSKSPRPPMPDGPCVRPPCAMPPSTCPSSPSSSPIARSSSMPSNA